MQNKKAGYLKTLSSVIFIICAGLFIKGAHAACTANNTTVPVPATTFNIPSYGITVGKVMSNWIEVTSPFVSGCSAQIYSIQGSANRSSTGLTYSENGVSYLVLDSGTPGVGFVTAIKTSTASTYIPVTSTGFFWLMPSTGSPQGTAVSVSVRLKLISTASVAPGTFNIPSLLILGSYVYGSGGTTNTLGQGFVSTSSFAMKVTTNTCAVTTPGLNVPLDDVSDSDLPGIASTAKEKDFHVLLNCQAGVNVYAQLIATQDPDTSTDGVIQITNPGAASSAKGVAIQIVDNNHTPLKIGLNQTIKYSAGGNEDLTFYARYYRTRTNLSAGAANAVATLNINYQ